MTKLPRRNGIRRIRRARWPSNDQLIGDALTYVVGTAVDLIEIQEKRKRERPQKPQPRGLSDASRKRLEEMLARAQQAQSQ
jgi:hypothetical protein